MWPSIKRWSGWGVSEPGGPSRLRPGHEALHVASELAGLVLPGPVVPWCADAVTVEAGLKLPAGARCLDDFALQLSDRSSFRPEALRPDDAGDRHRLFFRFAPPAADTLAELTWRGRPLGRIDITAQGPDDFLRQLKVSHATVQARIGDVSVACQSAVASQCQGWSAVALVSSTVPIAPLAALGLRVEIHNEADDTTSTVPVLLTAAQLASRQTLVQIDPRTRSRRGGPWTITWKAGDIALERHRFRWVPASYARRSLRVAGTRFVAKGTHGTVIQRHAPAADEATEFGPCFLLALTEPGLAARFPLEVAPLGVNHAAWTNDVVVTDGPTPVMPGRIPFPDAERVTGFELRVRGKLLASLPAHPAPAVRLTAEGGFEPPGEFPWNAAAEEELAARLGKLAGL
ncbi:MAG: hypothetical protein K1X57_14080 [Gemmataceae bacterium]|nr:hypothetical protein [Gemmataceae bacterium]